MKRLSIIITLGIGLLGFSQQDEPELGALITDRPDATESPNVVPQGFLQVETGAFFETFEDQGLKTEDFTLNTTLLRFGLLKNLELRVGWDFVEGKTKVDGNTLDDVSNGFSPLLLGVKIPVAKESGCWPEIGFLGHLYLPFTAGSDYKTQNTGVDFRFSLAHTLSERSSIAYNLGAQWRDDSPEASYVYTIAYGYGISEKVGAYIELYGNFPENSSAHHLWDAGITYLISNSVQLDGTIGSSLTKGQDILISAGASFRLPL